MAEDYGRRAPEPVAQRLAEELTERLFRGLPRADQRRWAGAYLRGLLSTPGKKSVRNMGWTVGASDTAWQSLHQVVNASTWRWEPVRRSLALWCARREPVRGVIVAPVLIPKRGRCSVGVHRRFDPASNRTVSCQWALGLFLATDRGAVPVDWQLHLPGRWSEDEELRRRTSVPREQGFSSPHEVARDLLDSPAADPGAGTPVLTATTTGAAAFALISHLAQRRRDFAIGVPASTPLTVGLLRSAPGSPRTAHLAGARSAGEILRLTGPGADAPPAGRPRRLRTAPAVVHVPGSSLPLRLLAAPPAEGRPHRVWLTGADGPELQGVAGLLTGHDIAAPGLDTLEQLGLYDFEGRSFPGWHRHMTLVSAACAHQLLADGEHGATAAALGTVA
ncbi:IS701 family transposase [Streptomyces boncukensis]|uniref:Transposase n=1 Tax=Streptomyces boncukensis TaxID=2711219 RepID=A0A6G4WU06_9ACTN|nr:transposase [Streptomyces boncukensis]NGO67951.1 transposase [Streptomyces boncukensis]